MAITLHTTVHAATEAAAEVAVHAGADAVIGAATTAAVGGIGLWIGWLFVVPALIAGFALLN